MKTWMKVLIGVVVAIVVIAGFVIGTKNGIISASNVVDEKKAEIETYLQRRCDLIPNLVETVKGYASHESNTLRDVTNARAGLSEAVESGDLQKMSEANDKLNIAINAVAEAYPDLKANQNFLSLQDQLEGTENRIATARSYYNEAVRKYNNTIMQFPGSLFAGGMGMIKKDYFEATTKAETEVPAVKFN